MQTKQPLIMRAHNGPVEKSEVKLMDNMCDTHTHTDTHTRTHTDRHTHTHTHTHTDTHTHTREIDCKNLLLSTGTALASDVSHTRELHVQE